MKIIIFLMFMSCLLPVQPQDTDRYVYCESCLKTAQDIENKTKAYAYCPLEIEKAMKEAPDERRQEVVENLISGNVCEKLLSFRNEMKSSCMHLLDSHYDQFHVALLNKEPKHLDIILCYEQSRACVGVKRQSFQSSKSTSTEMDIEALLRDNKEHVRIAQPVHSGSPAHSKDEL